MPRVEASQLQRAPKSCWREFWAHSAVELNDQQLEGIWYRNQYFLACCLRKGKVAPGLFGNWSTGDIGTAWHGDYHMDYNCQQVFWGVFSAITRSNISPTWSSAKSDGHFGKVRC